MTNSSFEALTAVSTSRYTSRGSDAITDTTAVEAPVAIVFNGISYVVMMATPQSTESLEHLALGFALSEGIVDEAAAMYSREVIAHPDGFEVQSIISTRAFEALKDRQRSLRGITGCGVCGIESLAAWSRPIAKGPERLKSDEIPAQCVRMACHSLPKHQPLNARCGGLHAAAWANLDGQLMWAYEDVGRHNALDKLIGKLAVLSIDLTQGFAVMSSRASHELVDKCARAGIHTLAVISAPTSLAVDHAAACGLSLWAFVRGEQAVCYAPAQEK